MSIDTFLLTNLCSLSNFLIQYLISHSPFQCQGLNPNTYTCWVSTQLLNYTLSPQGPLVDPAFHLDTICSVVMSLSSVVGYDILQLVSGHHSSLEGCWITCHWSLPYVFPMFQQGFGVLGRKSTRVNLHPYPIWRWSPSTQHIWRLFGIQIDRVTLTHLFS